MTRFIEIDGKTYRFDCCYDCPFVYVSDALNVYCSHPEGEDMDASPYDFRKNWFPKGCPARKVKK